MTPTAPILDQDSRELLELLAFVYLENDRPEKAAVLLAALHELALAGPRQQQSLALAWLRAGHADQALALLDGLALEGHTDAVFHLLRAQCLTALARATEAAAAMRAYIAARAATGAEAPPSP